MPVTKRQLRWERRQKLNAWLADRGLILDERFSWSESVQDAEQAAFDGFDAEYETAKGALEDELTALDAEALSDWFAEIGWTPTGETPEEQIDDYLTNA